MDFGATISRAFRIMWNYKVLWILGFLAALASIPGDATQGTNFVNRFSSAETGPVTADPNVILAGAGVFLCLALIIGIVLFVVGLIARGGLISGVQQVETQGNTTFGQSWSAGVARFWPLLGLNVLLYLPLIILVVIVAVLFGGAIIGFFAAGEGFSQSGTSPNPNAAFGLVGVFVVLCCVACVLGIYALLAMALQTFGERAIMMENMGVMDSVRRAWAVFRANLGNIILLALVMAVIAWVIGLVVGAVVLAVMAPTVFPLFGQMGSSGFISAGQTVVALIGIVIGVILGAIINTLYITFNSAAWTLAYRQFTGAAPAVTATPAAPPPLPAP